MRSLLKKKLPPPEKKPVRRAVALGGGGAKGAYQIGVWQAFRELGMDFHVVTGTSVGALNGALMAQGSYAEAVEMWENMSNDLVLSDVPPVEEGQPGSVLEAYRAYVREIVQKGGVDPSPLEGQIRRILDEDKLRGSGIRYGVVTVAMDTLKPVELFAEEMPAGMVADYMMASASCFPAFRPKEIGDKKYIDGGYHDLLPVELALRARPTVDEVYAVDIDGIGIRRPTHTDVPVHIIRSYWDLGSMIIFEKSQSRRDIRLGYLDTLKVLGRCDGRAYAFRAGQKRLLEERYLEDMSEICLGVFDSLPKVGRSQVERLVEARVTDILSRRGEGESGYGELLFTAAELAGELLGLDPTRLYTVEEFNGALRTCLADARRESGPEAALEALKRLPLTKLGEALKELTSGVLLQLCMEAVKQYLMNAETFFKPELLAMAVPRQMMAAMYLMVLEREQI